MKKLTIGILAHVDAGKTTLSEAVLYTCGAVKKLGRVDNRDSFLDSNTEERRRGITVFSKQARCNYKDSEITFIDTPGHVDFSGEMERTLQILDYAVLVISGTDGVQSHTSTLWSLLEKYNIPTFIFITKMDVSNTSCEDLLYNLTSSLSPLCTDFTGEIDDESVALCDEDLLEKYLETGRISEDDISDLISKRKIFPCIFGSGLKLINTERLLEVIYAHTREKEYADDLSAVVYKIARDNQGKRLTFAKITGGSLSVREQINGEKISQIRLYSGQKYEATDKVSSGDVCALLGLNSTYIGQFLGGEKKENRMTMSPVLTYKVILPKGVDAISVYPYFKELEEEDPLLNTVWNDKYGEIEIQLMGKVQIEILKSIILERFNLDVTFDSGRVLYKETIEEPVEGIGHYEPLKHYAEVHLLMEPLKRGSGLQFESSLPTDELDLNWQRLILTHLAEKVHTGVLTGSPITDMKITLIAGKAHIKHTEGGDFRQATYRAVRQGLMTSKSVLLEPMYNFMLTVPNECVGRAISDIRQKYGTSESPVTGETFSVIKGSVPASEMGDYQSEVMSYTGGRGTLSLIFSGYDKCHNEASVIASFDYNPLSDLENTPDSVFCSHGAGVNIPWDKVSEYCHIPPRKEDAGNADESPTVQKRTFSYDIDEAELEEIMYREFGPIKRKSYTSPVISEPKNSRPANKVTRIIVDGYNVIFSWDELKKIASDNLDLAREKLINTLTNYQAYTGIETVLVFDAYLVDSPVTRKYDSDKLHVVFTEKGTSADSYIERLVDEIGKNVNVKVVSSDSMIQLTAVNSGVLRLSSREFKYDVDQAIDSMRNMIT